MKPELAADRFESAAKFAEALTNPAFTLPTTQAAPVAAATVSAAWSPLSMSLAALAALMTVVALWAWLRPIPEPVSRYSVSLPANEAMFGGGSRLAVSPDGSRLVYVGEGEGDTYGLWVRDLDRLHATPAARPARGR
ncbi:MAG: hypothetical protein IIA27_01315 [Gemmatimonadetes bacterium]|nr:hypothetical protein [Gemmatimonadota bacterium]